MVGVYLRWLECTAMVEVVGVPCCGRNIRRWLECAAMVRMHCEDWNTLEYAAMFEIRYDGWNTLRWLECTAMIEIHCDDWNALR